MNILKIVHNTGVALQMFIIPLWFPRKRLGPSISTQYLMSEMCITSAQHNELYTRWRNNLILTCKQACPFYSQTCVTDLIICKYGYKEQTNGCRNASHLNKEGNIMIEMVRQFFTSNISTTMSHHHINVTHIKLQSEN